MPDHPHADPGDGRTECGTCGKWVWPVIHSCKGVPVTAAARARAREGDDDTCPPIVKPVVEHAIQMSGGGMHIRSDDPEIERIYPLAEWIPAQQRFGGKVWHRTVIVVEDWTEVEA